jgi:catechol 2,3-dioxygenase-like lactoylglutathione lyase family enzyme
MNHFTVLTDDVERTTAFYGELLGLHPGARPDLAVPGVWLYAQDHPVLHIVGGCSKQRLVPGVIDHIAFTATDLAATLATLDRAGIKHTCGRQPGTRLWQVFFTDPNGARVELDFDPSEPDAH